MKTYELLSDESKLNRRNYASSENDPNYFTNPRSNPETGVCKAVKWDIIGALMHCYPNNEEFYKHFDVIVKSELISKWIDNYIKGLNEMDYNKLKRNYGSNWAIFNDHAPFSVIKSFLQGLNV